MQVAVHVVTTIREAESHRTRRVEKDSAMFIV